LGDDRALIAHADRADAETVVLRARLRGLFGIRREDVGVQQSRAQRAGGLLEKLAATRTMLLHVVGRRHEITDRSTRPRRKGQSPHRNRHARSARTNRRSRSTDPGNPIPRWKAWLPASSRRRLLPPALHRPCSPRPLDTSKVESMARTAR